MAELKIYLPDELDTRFRKAAMVAYGFGKGSISKAAEEALRKWCAEKETDASKNEPSKQKSEPVKVEDKTELPAELKPAEADSPGPASVPTG